jgi:hypothetical protein
MNLNNTLLAITLLLGMITIFLIYKLSTYKNKK